MKKKTKPLQWLGVALGLGCASAMAGTFTANFNTDPGSFLDYGGTKWDGVTTSHTGGTRWQQSGGVPAGATATGPAYGVAGDGFLQLTFANPDCTAQPPVLTTYLIGGVLFNDFDNGLVVAGFTFECDLRIGNGNPNPADGFSINYVRNNDPALVCLQNVNPGTGANFTFADMNNATVDPVGTMTARGQLADNGNGGDPSLMEEGTVTGVSIGFDMWDSGNYTIPPTSPAVGTVAPGFVHDGIGLDVRVDGVLVGSVPMPNGTTQGTSDPFGNALTATDTVGTTGPTNATSIETGPYDGTGCDTNLAWVHLKVDVNTNGQVNVWWKGVQILTNLQTTYFASPGRLLMGARVGGNTANIDVDNVSIVTIPSAKFLIGPANGTPTGFSIQVADSGSSVVDPTSAQLKLNGVAVTPTSVTKTGNNTLVVFRDASNPLPPGSTNIATLTLKDTQGTQVTGDRSFVVPAYISLPATDAVTGVDTSKPGFQVRAYQVTTNLTWPLDLNRIARAEAELHGDVGANIADLTGFTGGATNDTGPINYSRTIWDTTNGVYFVEPAGDYTVNSSPSKPDKATPGIPNKANEGQDPATGNPAPYNDNDALEILTYLEFPKAGVYKLTCNSDDGFRLQIGKGDAARDQLNATAVAEYDTGRGAADSTQTIYVPTNGIYAVRLLWFNGGGGAEVELSAVNDDGVAALVNDSSVTGSLKAYAARTGATPPVVSYLMPIKGTTPTTASSPVLPSTPITAEITDGSADTVDQGSITLKIDGATVQPTITKSGNVTKVVYTPADWWPSGSSHTNVLGFTAGSVTRSDTYAWSVVTYATVPPSLALPTAAVDKSKPGFLLKNYQMNILRNTSPGPDYANPGNSSYDSETMIRGLYGWPNTADLTKYTGPNGSYVETTAINYKGGGGDTAANEGNFVDDGSIAPFVAAPNMPGEPALAPNDTQEAGYDYYAIEMLTVLEFTQPGLYWMGVNSDDGFRITVGNPKETAWNLMPVVVGEYSGGKGASDVLFYFRITQPGLYPFRNLYEEGGGGNNVEWFTMNNNSWHVLVNDTATPSSIKAYQYPVASAGSPYVKSFAPGRSNAATAASPARAGSDATVKAVIDQGAGTVDTASVSLKVDGAAVTPTVTKAGSEVTVTYQPAAGFAAGSHDVALTFGDRTVNWTFGVGLPKTPTFWIEAGDYNYSGGQTKPEASVMPYAGGAFAGTTGTAGTDFNGPNESDNCWYRYPATQMVPMSFANDRDRGGGEVQVNFRIGWGGGGQWYNYTRTFPAGKMNAYVDMSSGSKGDVVGGKLEDVTSGTPVMIGVFNQPVTQGGWGNNDLIPMKDAATTNNIISFDFGGTRTLRFTLLTGDYNGLLFAPEASVLPQFTAVTPNANGTITLTWTGGGTLQYTTALAPTGSSTWTDVTGAASPYTIDPATLGNPPVLFGRIKQ